MDQFKTESPIPQKTGDVSMTFGDAIQAILSGNKVARLEWKNQDYGFLAQDGYLSINRNGNNHQWLVNDGDMQATDWVIFEGAN